MVNPSLELIAVILGTAEDGIACPVLDAARIAGSDPLDYCIAAGLVSEQDATARMAAWLDIAHFHKVPVGISEHPAPVRLDALANVRTYRLRVLDQDVLFCAPSFANVLEMRGFLTDRRTIARRLCLVPAGALRDFLAQTHSLALLDETRRRLVRRWPWATANLELTTPARLGFVALLLAITASVLVSPFLAYPVLVPVAAMLVAVPALVSLAALLTPHAQTSRDMRPGDAELPVYSVLIPLRNEAHMVPQLARAMLALDYPRDRLDIKFVVEARSPKTVAAARAQCRRGPFSVVEVPDAAPHTKPKAICFALPLCRGEHVVVFDAEDTPHPSQLWRAALQFRRHPELECLQAPLVIDNMADGVLAILFAGEYAGLFGVKLPALARWDLPVPLGGTSNHFRTKTLRRLGGWDTYNVTEDADLGVRLARMRLKVEMLGVPTYEEAPNRLRTWMAQRTRWMKGWMQTFVVHNRRPWQTLRDMGWRRFVAFEVLTLGQIMAPILHSAFIAQGAIKLAIGMPLWGETGGWTLLYPAMFLAGYAAAIAQTIVGTYRLGWRPNFLAQLLLPGYWLLISIATVRAMYELVEKPFYWAKTPHRRVARWSRTIPDNRPIPVRAAAGE